jgi:hypothetical protein
MKYHSLQQTSIDPPTVACLKALAEVRANVAICCLQAARRGPLQARARGRRACQTTKRPIHTVRVDLGRRSSPGQARIDVVNHEHISLRLKNRRGSAICPKLPF